MSAIITNPPTPQPNRVEKAEAAWEEMRLRGITPNAKAYTTMMTAYGKAGQLDKCLLCALDSYLLSTLPPTRPPAHTCYLLQVEKAEAAWEEMRLRGITPDAKAYTTMMTVYGKAGQPGKAEELLDAMLAAACKPSPVTLCSLVTAFGLAGRPDDAQRVFDKVLLLDAMLAAACKPSPVTLCSLVTAFGLAGRPDDAQRVFDKVLRCQQPSAVAAFKRMLAAGLAPDDLSHYPLPPRCFPVLQAQTDIKPDCHVFTALSAAFGLNGRTDEAVAAFKRMLAAGLAPDDRSMARLVEAHGSMERQLDRQLALLAGKGAEGGKEGGAEGGEEGGEKRRGEEKEEEEGQRRGEEGAGVGRREASEEEKLRCRQAVKLVLELEGAGIRPGVETYTALISLFASHGLGVETYTALISLFASHGLGESLLSPPPVCLFVGSPLSMSVNLHWHSEAGVGAGGGGYQARRGDLHRSHLTAVKLVLETKGAGIRPGVETYTALISLFASHGLVREAAEVFEEMQRVGLQPRFLDYTVLSWPHPFPVALESSLHTATLSPPFLAVREAAEVFEEMQRVGLQPNAIVHVPCRTLSPFPLIFAESSFLSYSLRACRGLGQLRPGELSDAPRCFRVRKTMQVLGWTLNPPIVRGMVRALVAGGQGVVAADLVREAEEDEGVVVDGDVKKMAQMHARELVH
ncbi:unnamed protein product [Closterium sp. Naga37s-1]|nr:unnamed protein product [Closterium sp. Naga37s-1]